VTAVIMDMRTIANNLRQHLRQNVSTFIRQFNQTPGLVVMAMCDDRATIDNIRSLSNVATDAGIHFSAQLFPNNVKIHELRKYIEQHNQDTSIHAISLQLPLPKHLNVDEVASFISPEKDVEGLHPTNMGHLLMGKPNLVPSSALSAIKLLGLYNINPASRHAVIVGRSLEVGRPLACLLTKADATVTLCHTQTNNLLAHTRQAEILIVAVGEPGLIKAEMIRPGAVVIDYGLNYMSRDKVTGDVEFERSLAVAGAITPVPGGIGPLTNICLLENVLKAARAIASVERPSPRAIIDSDPLKSEGKPTLDYKPNQIPPMAVVGAA